jgi:hypothetical protein
MNKENAVDYGYPTRTLISSVNGSKEKDGQNTKDS